MQIMQIEVNYAEINALHNFEGSVYHQREDFYVIT